MFDHPDDPGARPVQSAQVRVELTDNLKVQSEETGEIVIDGPMVSPGYLDAPERNQQQFDDRGFHTGDVGRFDSNGRVHVHGRMDDMIISGGELVAPEEIQSVLCDHSKVKDVAVVELSSDKWGTVAGALVRRSENEFPDPEELRNYCRERLADYKIPKKWIIRDQIPQTKSGKIDRQTIKDDLKTA